MFMEGIAIMIQLTAIFKRDPLISAIIGSFSFPDACRIAFSIKTMQTKNDAIPMMLSKPGPAL